jgi:hypothetical protein
MARKPKNPINDIVDTVGGWLGGRGPGTNPQVQAAMDATRAVGKVVDTATGGFGQALISDAQRMAQSGSSTPSALYKTAAVNLGAAAAGVGAAKVVGKAASKVVESGVPARVANKVTGQQVIVHGGKVRGLSQIDPRIPSNFPAGNRAVYGMNPEYTILARGMPEPTPSRPLKLAEIANEYAEGGSAYVAKVPKTSITNPASVGSKAKVAVIQSTSPAKVVAEIPLSGTSAAQLAKQQQAILRAAKRAGAKIPKYK